MLLGLRNESFPFLELVEEMIELVRPDATDLGCLPQVERARTIATEGSSADRQRVVMARTLAGGASPEEAGMAVVDHLIGEFLKE